MRVDDTLRRRPDNTATRTETRGSRPAHGRRSTGRARREARGPVAPPAFHVSDHSGFIPSRVRHLILYLYCSIYLLDTIMVMCHTLRFLHSRPYELFHDGLGAHSSGWSQPASASLDDVGRAGRRTSLPSWSKRRIRQRRPDGGHADARACAASPRSQYDTMPCGRPPSCDGVRLADGSSVASRSGPDGKRNCAGTTGSVAEQHFW
jgi:hypothetical protein